MKSKSFLSNYLVYEDGSVYSLLSNKFLSQRANEFGYKVISLTVAPNETKIFKVHRLVAKAFIPNPLNKPEVNHIDGDKTNNHVSNLEWVTSKENKDHAWVNGLYKDKLEDHHMAKLTNENIHTICKMIEEGMRNIDIAKEFNVSKDHISHIKRGDTWKEISSMYNFSIKRQSRKSITTVKNICEMIKLGLTDHQIIDKIPNLSKTDLIRIRRKETFKNISDNYF